jgi:hypothetical protein
MENDGWQVWVVCENATFAGEVKCQILYFFPYMVGSRGSICTLVPTAPPQCDTSDGRREEHDRHYVSRPPALPSIHGGLGPVSVYVEDSCSTLYKNVRVIATGSSLTKRFSQSAVSKCACPENAHRRHANTQPRSSVERHHPLHRPSYSHDEESGPNKQGQPA